MKLKINYKKTGLAIGIILLLIQFIRIDKTNAKVDPTQDLINQKQTPAEIASILKTSCYDCHSNEARYPWYTNIAPVSWWIKHHINEGSEHLNFSTWGTYNSRKADHKLEECVEMLAEDEMPLFSYTMMHSDAKLTEAQKISLIDYFNSLRTHESDEQEE